MSDRASPSIVLLSGRTCVLADCGPGSLRELVSAGIPHQRVSHVFLTHFHPDHCTDLIPFLFVTRSPRTLPERSPILLTGPVGIAEFLAGIRAPFSPWLDLPEEILSVVSLPLMPLTTHDYGEFRVTSSPTGHTAAGLAYCFEIEGQRIVYSGDTPFSPAVEELARDADLLLLECSFPEGQAVKGHLTPSEAGRLAQRARARWLVLLHFYPETLASDIAGPVRREFSGTLTLAVDRLEITLPSCECSAFEAASVSSSLHQPSLHMA